MKWTLSISKGNGEDPNPLEGLGGNQKVKDTSSLGELGISFAIPEVSVDSA